MLAGSLLYLSQKTESFFGGRFFTKEQLGFLLLARQLAEIPNSKILALITSVSFPIFCRYQKLPDKAFAFLKNFLKTTAIFSLPLYIGSAIVGDLAIPIILGQKWSPMVMPFSILCFSYLFCTLLTSPAQTIANAIEKPHLPMVFNFCSFLVLLAGCLVATKSHNFIGLVLPWLVVHGILGLVLFSYVLGKARIPVLPSLAALIKPIIATVFMALSILITRHYLLIENKLVLLVLLIGIGGTVYSSLIYLFEKATFLKMLHALKTKHVADAYNSEEIKA